MEASGRQNHEFGSGFSVQYKQLKICFLVGYLGLLLNLGPSLHHAPFLGLHDHGAIGESSYTSKSCASSGCCGSHSLTRTHSGDEQSLACGLRSDCPPHSCTLCKFFDQLHVIVDSVETIDCLGFVLMRDLEGPASVCPVSFAPVARGPPAIV